jgi:hypothetical protein
LIKSSKPTYSAPAARAASAAAPGLAKTSTRTVLPLPCGNGTVPRTIWSDCFGIHAEFERHVNRFVEFGFGKLGEDFDG